MRTARYAAAGFLLGVVWGVAARVWMRLISTAPEFTWAGTLSIIVAAAVAGLALGLVAAARARGASRWWRLLSLVALVAFQGLGVILLPAVIGGGWGLRRGVVGRILAVMALLSAPAILLALSWEDVDTYVGPYPVSVFLVIAAGGVLLLVAAAAWGSSLALGPWDRRARPAAAEATDEVVITA